MNYHAHVYWNNDQEKALAVSLRNHLKSLGCPLGRVIDVPIGPHPLPMFQVMYDSHNQKVVEDYLKKTNLSILLHEDIGEDHVRDHTKGARWIGKPLDLNLEFLRQFQELS
ncbi:MAG: DOPA 4,5-dioxygenase family protein [Pelagibacteraceae bacterium]